MSLRRSARSSMGFKAFLGVGIWFGLLFAGCIGVNSAAPASAPSGGPQVASGPAEFNETTGGIEGTITDTELAPIPGAVVGLIADASTTTDTVTTDATGHFALSHVKPGQ